MLPDEAVRTSQLVGRSCLPCEALVCGLVLTKVTALDCSVVERRDHECKTHYHVEVAN